MKHSDETFVFVNLSVDSGYYGVNHGIACLVPVVRRHGFNVRLLNVVDNISGEEFGARLEALHPSIVGFSCTSPQVKYLKKYSAATRALPDVLQIAGGAGPTLDPDGVLCGTSVDATAIGEGERPLDALLREFRAGGDIHSVEGLYWKLNGKVIRNPVPQFIPDLSGLDIPDYSIFDRDVVQHSSAMNLMLSRGCPYSCTYCSNKALRSVYPSARGHFRVPSVEHSMEILEAMLEQYPGTRYIHFEDDLLIANKEWFLAFADEYRSRIGLPYRIAVRIECVDSDIVKAMVDSGCTLACLGLESGSETLRSTVLNRHHTNAQIIEKSRMIKAAGIKLFTFNMVGLPLETCEQMRETLALNKKIGSDCGACNFFLPFPGTALHEMCMKEGLIESKEHLEELSNYNTRPVIRLTPAQEKEAIRVRKKLLHHLWWRDLKYEHRAFASGHRWPAAALNVIRLFGVYVLQRLSSRYKRGSLYRRVMDNRLRIWLWRKVRQLCARQHGG